MVQWATVVHLHTEDNTQDCPLAARAKGEASARPSIVFIQDPFSVIAISIGDAETSYTAAFTTGVGSLWDRERRVGALGAALR
jgi:hypothetical protein